MSLPGRALFDLNQGEAIKLLMDLDKALDEARGQVAALRAALVDVQPDNPILRECRGSALIAELAALRHLRQAVNYRQCQGDVFHEVIQVELARCTRVVDATWREAPRILRAPEEYLR